ncbi:MDR family oxidoreductase [Pseudofrankia inefficax]|uniref:Quinone oxidoreductase, YhdH/YhfP family n=1 Tax=Pseudofrankia inefficax (strain DSM 45817 / CECT 9037 / DDB 130130 / EuI1c) TaxID=298654 RepID=E3IWL4_PSEI1|nr:MDR family oxidoreductase [Pseudofrankia inefficax]ADP81344.1 quinone oxidoreductase, YhdH/YhfP family [Pseudofrankia inefficax]
MVRAVVLTDVPPASLVDLAADDLPDGDVTIDVRWSSLNYKDGLAVTGAGRIARKLPMTCGADLAGTVAASENPAVRVGAEVLVTGWGLSETRPGGYTQRQRVPASMVTARPEGLSLRQTMAIGTAGLTSMLCVTALEGAGLRPGAGPVLVTGASGGVGSLAVALLASLGYEVTASTGSPDAHPLLRELGAAEIIDRAELAAPGRPLGKERWAAAIDTVGSQTLASVLASIRYGGAVAACGLAGGNDLPATVLPFILRGVSLLGIDSVMCPPDLRDAAWSRLASDLPVSLLDRVTQVEPLSDIVKLGEQILAGEISGRVVVDVQA